VTPLPTGASGPVLKREDAIVLLSTLGLALIGFLLLLGVGVPKIVLWIIISGGAALAFARPEIGLFALILNALIGLTHLTALPRVGPLSVSVAFEGILVVSVLYHAVFRRRKLFIASPQHLIFLALAAWMIISLLVNGGVGPGNIAAIRNLFLVRMLIFFLLTNILLDGSALKRLVVVLMAANAGLVTISFLVREGRFGVEMMSYSEKILRTSGIVHNANSLAFDLTAMLLFCIAAFFYVQHPLLKLILAGLAVFDILAILTTLSRSGFISLCAVLLFLFMKMTRNLKAGFSLAALAVIVWWLLPWGLLFRFERVEEVGDIDRVKFARVGLSMAADNPIVGVGFGNYIERFFDHNVADLQKSVPAHNMYLNLSAQMGFPALVLYLLAVGILWRRLMVMEAEQKAHGGTESFLYYFGIAVQAFFVNLLVFGLSGDVEFEYSVFILMGFGILLYREHQRRMAGGAPTVRERLSV